MGLLIIAAVLGLIALTVVCAPIRIVAYVMGIPIIAVLAGGIGTTMAASDCPADAECDLAALSGFSVGVFAAAAGTISVVIFEFARAMHRRRGSAVRPSRA